jgi:hypothetical protein
MCEYENHVRIRRSRANTKIMCRCENHVTIRRGCSRPFRVLVGPKSTFAWPMGPVLLAGPWGMPSAGRAHKTSGRRHADSASPSALGNTMRGIRPRAERPEDEPWRVKAARSGEAIACGRTHDRAEGNVVPDHPSVKDPSPRVAGLDARCAVGVSDRGG